MDALFVGIDVSKDRLDVALRPGEPAFTVDRTGSGIDEMIDRLKSVAVTVISIEAAASKRWWRQVSPAPACRLSSSIRRRYGRSHRRSASAA